MSMNKLNINGGFIELLGFDSFGNDTDVTFCFYPKGIVICPKTLENKPFYVSVKLKDKKTDNQQLLKVLNEKSVIYFTYDNVTDKYFEIS